MATEHKNEHRGLRGLDLGLLSLILVVGLAFRLYRVNIPLSDFHSWRQADTAAVARNFVRNGFDLMHPKYDDLSSIQSGIENPQGYRFVEFPLYNAIFALTFKALPSTAIEIHGRLISIAFSLLIISIIYYLTKHEIGTIGAVAASGTYAVFPFFVFFSRVVLPETTALGFMFISIFCLYLWHDEDKVLQNSLLFIGSFVTFAAALLIKPTIIFYGLALLYLFIRRYQFSFIRKFNFYLYFLLAAIPLVLWRYYIRSFPEGIPASGWLITSVNTYQGLQNIFLRPAFFRWIFYERINNIILGGYVTAFLVFGLIAKPKRYLVHIIFASALSYLLVFEGGNVQHEYYQTLILPALAILVGQGVQIIANNKREYLHPVFTWSAVSAVFVLSFLFSYYHVKDYYNYSSDLSQRGNIIKTLTKRTDKIITDSTGDTTLLYLSDRQGAPAVYKDLSELKKLGYTYVESDKKDVITSWKNENQYQLIFENDSFALFKL